MASNSHESISSYAKKGSLKLSVRIFLAGFISVFLSGLMVGSYYHYTRLSLALDLTSEALGQPLALGGAYLPARMTKGITNSTHFEDIWVETSSGDILVDGHKNDEGQKLQSIREKSVYWKNSSPHVLVKKSIRYNQQKVGTIWVGYKIPIVSILLLAFVVSVLFSLIAYYLYYAIRRFAAKIVRPLDEYTTFVESEVEKDNFESSGPNWRIKEIQSLHSIITNYFKKYKENEILARQAISNAQLLKVASRVKHDAIASLVIGESALETVKTDAGSISTLRSVFERIKNTVDDIPKFATLTEQEIDQAISGDFETEEEAGTDVLRRCHLASIIFQIVGEMKLSPFCQSKNIQFPIEYDEESFSSFSEIEANRFKRTLINLYKNAVEAIEKKGTITTRIELVDGLVKVSIVDNGKGIPKNLLPKIGKRGATFNKNGGSGIGISAAIEDLSRWDGQLEIESKEVKGTTVQLSIPLSKEDYLYPTQLVIPETSKIVIADDDPLIHKAWQTKFEEAAIPNQHLYCRHSYSIDETKEIINKLNSSGDEFILLIDNDLRDPQTKGIDLIEELELADKSILVTTNGSSNKLYLRCQKIGLPIVSKSIQSNLEVMVV